jgi:molybdopterin molybdotransferase
MTGAPLPGGADAVVKVEDTTQSGDRVRISEGVVAGENVRLAGGDLVAGTVVFEAGTRLTPHHLGVLTSIGAFEPVVRRRPVVAVLSTGDEVVSASTPSPGKIHDSNRPQLIALLDELGADVIDLGIVGDDQDELRAVLARGSAEADVLFSSGGVSMGEYDMVKKIVAESGDVQLWRVAIKPAKPIAFGHLAGTPFFGLPGNPVSVVVAFEQFARPALLKMMGATALFRSRIPAVLATAVQTFRSRLPAVLATAVETDPEKTVFLRTVATLEGDRWVARPATGQASNQLTALARANAFAVVPVGTAGLEAGSRVELEMFRWPEGRTEQEVLNV